MQSDKIIYNDRILQNDKRIPTDKVIQNNKRLQIDGNMQNDRRIPIDRKLQNDRRIPIDRTLQSDRRIPTDRTLQNDRRIPIDRTLQSDRRIPTDRTLQNDRRILTGQHDRMHNDQKNKNNSVQLEMQNNRRVHSASLSDGIMEEDRRKRINRILNNDRLSKNELQKKIDSLTQNKNIQHDGRRMLNLTMQNDRQTQNDLEVQNARGILDERNQEMINARRTGYEKRMWAATPHRAPRQRDWPANPQNIARQSHSAWVPYRVKKHKAGKSKFNESEFKLPNYTMPKLLGKEADAFVRNLVWYNLEKNLEKVHYTYPYQHSWMISRACHIIATTHVSAQTDVRKYFSLRYFYQNNLAYEVGYLVNEIVLKYQRMLELYDLGTKYYYKNRARFYAPSTYVLYLYTSVLEMGKVLAHLCNMLNEMEDKYRFIPVNQSGFSDYHLERNERVYSIDGSMAEQIAAYEKALVKLKREKQRKRRKVRPRHLKLDMIETTAGRRPKFSNFPLSYGWSIEDTW